MSSSIRTAIVMSRLPRLIEPDVLWLRGLRAALRRVRERGETLLVGQSTAGGDFVRRGAERLAIPVLTIEPVSSDLSREGTASPADGIPARDRSVLDAADVVIVLGLRANGNLHRLLRERLAARREVVLTDLADLRPIAVSNELTGLGASMWMPDESAQHPFRDGPAEAAKPEMSGTDADSRPGQAVYEIVPFPSHDEWSFLSHTTRACPGPWPEQTQADYLDSLFDGRPDADHSTVATLARIVTQRRVIASGRTIRGGHRVVGFTAVPLLDLPQLHQFRAHRGRWDFEPFGLCIRREWLQRRGARPAVYGDESAWHGLPEADRPFFQLARSDDSRVDAHRTSIDWSVEREWRHNGDLDLSDLSARDALVFLPNFEAARRLSVVSPWPITLWPDPAAEMGYLARMGW